MAPVTRKASIASSNAESNNQKIQKVKKDRPSPIKSVLRHKLQGATKGRKVTFDAKEHDNVAYRHLPTTPHPVSNQLRFSPPAALSPQTPIDLSKRKEQEELMKRAHRALNALAKSTDGLPSPPPSPRGVRRSPFVELGKSPAEQPAKTAKNVETTSTKEVEFSTQGDSPKIANVDLLTPEILNTIKDEIPRGLELPATIDDILIEPSAEIRMEEICTAFDYLKIQIQRHCRSFYSFKQRGHPVPSFTYLKVKHPELFHYIQYVADGSQYGWDKLLSVGPQRENLVYAIISRALMAHLFDAELFGASAEDEEELLEMCREYLHFDAFVRNTHRAEIVNSILSANAEEHADNGKDPLTYFSPGLNTLVQRLNLLLAPLQHPTKHELIGSMHPHSSLDSILQTALKLHLAIRLAGSSGTVYRFETIHKLSAWDGETMNCVNQKRTDATAHHGEDPLVKICCFPAVFATVPSGPNLEKFSDPAFVKEWKEVFDDDAAADAADADSDSDPDSSFASATKPGRNPETPLSRKPLITTYPITLADVVLENTPSSATDRSAFLTLAQTIAREQSSVSNTQLHALTGTTRAKTPRSSPTRIVKSVKKTAKRAAVAVAVAAAVLGWYLFQPGDAGVAANRSGMADRIKNPVTLTPEVVLTAAAAATATKRRASKLKSRARSATSSGVAARMTTTTTQTESVRLATLVEEPRRTVEVVVVKEGEDEAGRGRGSGSGLAANTTPVRERRGRET